MTEPQSRGWLVLETNGRGHRSWFVRLLLDESSRRTPTRSLTIVSTPDAVATDAWRVHLAPSLQPFELVVTRRPLLKVARRILRSREYLVIPDGDRWLPGLCILSFVMRRRLVGSVLILRPNPVGSVKSHAAGLTKRSFRRALTQWSPGVRVFELVAAPVERGRKVLLDPIAFAPATVDREDWLAERDIARSSRVALLIGDISERKCVAELVRAARRSNLPGLVLVAVGLPTPAIRKVLLEAEGQNDPNVHVVEGFVSDEEFDTWVAIADAVCVIHRNEGSSGVLLKAWAAGTPVLVGGARSVITCARTLGAARIEVRSLQPHALAIGLEHAVSTERTHVATINWASRTTQFATAMLGP